VPCQSESIYTDRQAQRRKEVYRESVSVSERMKLWKKDVHKSWSIKVEGKIDIDYSLNISSHRILDMVESVE